MILNYIRGFYYLHISGGLPEKLLNTCSKRDIEILDLVHSENGYLIKIMRYDYKNFSVYAKKYGCKINVKQYSFILNDIAKLKYRYLFISGITFFVAFLVICSQYIWDITVDGNYTYTYEDIVKCANNMGIYDGSLKKDINCDSLEKNIRNTYFDITWVSAEIRGTRLIIHIKENFDDFMVTDEQKPYDIIANKEAKIISIITRSGTPMVKAGDEVLPGDTLISGAVPVLDNIGEFSRYEYVNSDGDIYGETKYTYNDELSLKHKVNIYTGKSKNSAFFEIFNLKLQTNPFAQKTSKNEKFESFNQIILFRNFYLPLYYGKIQYKYFEVEEQIYSDDEIIAIAKNNFNHYIDKLEERNVEILDYDFKYELADYKCRVTADITAVEKLGSIHSVEIIQEESTAEDEYN